MAYAIPVPIDPKLKSGSVPLVAGNKTRLPIDHLIAELRGLSQKVSAHTVEITAPSIPIIGPRIEFGAYSIDDKENARLGNLRQLRQFAKEVINGSF